MGSPANKHHPSCAARQLYQAACRFYSDTQLRNIIFGQLHLCKTPIMISKRHDNSFFLLQEPSLIRKSYRRTFHLGRSWVYQDWGQNANANDLRLNKTTPQWIINFKQLKHRLVFKQDDGRQSGVLSGVDSLTFAGQPPIQLPEYQIWLGQGLISKTIF